MGSFRVYFWAISCDIPWLPRNQLPDPSDASKAGAVVVCSWANATNAVKAPPAFYEVFSDSTERGNKDLSIQKSKSAFK